MIKNDDENNDSISQILEDMSFLAKEKQFEIFVSNTVAVFDALVELANEGNILAGNIVRNFSENSNILIIDADVIAKLARMMKEMENIVTVASDVLQVTMVTKLHEEELKNKTID